MNIKKIFAEKIEPKYLDLKKKVESKVTEYKWKIRRLKQLDLTQEILLHTPVIGKRMRLEKLLTSWRAIGGVPSFDVVMNGRIIKKFRTEREATNYLVKNKFVPDNDKYLQYVYVSGHRFAKINEFPENEDDMFRKTYTLVKESEIWNASRAATICSYRINEVFKTPNINTEGYNFKMSPFL